MHHGDDGHDSNARKLGSRGAFVTFFKSLFGAGLLSLPNVLGRVGLVLGVIIYGIVGIACAFSCYLLLEARHVTKTLNHRNQKHYDETEEDKEEYQHQRQRQTHHLVTYGDLADILLGPVMASVTRWTIIVLNILFTAGLAIVICENMAALIAELNGGHDHDYRTFVGLFLLPIVVVLLQIPWLQDMWLISVLGLAVYTVGVIGSTLFSAAWTISSLVAASSSSLPSNSPSSTIEATAGITLRGIPDDLWTIEWRGIPSFVGTAVYALEGINLALPTAHSMRKESDATWVVCSAVLWYGAVTIVFAAVGYAGGLGGGAGTGKTSEECDVVTNCITPPFLQYTIQVALSMAMTLSIPVMLYPSTEMLEVMLTDWHLEHKQQQQYQETVEPLVELEPLKLRQNANTAESSTYGSTTLDNQVSSSTHEGVSPPEQEEEEEQQQQDEDEESFSQEKSWKLRFILAIFTVTLGAITTSFTFFSGLIGAVGLSFAGFVLPPLLYLRAMEQAQLPLHWRMKCAMMLLASFGIYNMLAGGASSFKDLWHSFSQVE